MRVMLLHDQIPDESTQDSDQRYKDRVHDSLQSFDLAFDLGVLLLVLGSKGGDGLFHVKLKPIDLPVVSVEVTFYPSHTFVDR